MSQAIITHRHNTTQSQLSKDRALLKAQVTLVKGNSKAGWELASWTCSATVSWITRHPIMLHSTSIKARLSAVKLTTCEMPNPFNLRTSPHVTSNVVANSNIKTSTFNSKLYTMAVILTVGSDRIRCWVIRRYRLIDRRLIITTSCLIQHWCLAIP